ncbi:site-2 protease family protein [Clostridium manihotivorum]|uniref:Peptidase M50 domain-containing protein n=1 Tax=Clostridium manihotivorum TaxID=2320868 RepID=A0A3R5U8G4_9CLOT|nr:site-2 protease family protein [Clostridium manihotivorum]QAA31774.1 hypothetical protein C1I91_09015 [Clostridium manihotivorum]
MKKNNLYFSIFSITVFVVYAAVSFISFNKFESYIVLIGLLYSLACVILCTFLHELSHAIAAKILGEVPYNIYSIPFAFEKTVGRWKIKEVSFENRGKLGCVNIKLSKISSKEAYRKSILKMSIINIAGPVGSFIMAGILIAILNLVDYKLYCFIVAPLFVCIFIGVQALLIGDGKFAYLYIMDREFALVNLFKQYMYNNGDENEYMINLLVGRLKQLTKEELTYSKNPYQLLMGYLIVQYFLVHDIEKLPQKAKDFMDNMISEKERLVLEPRINYLSVQFFHLLVVYFALKERMGEAKMLLEFLNKATDHRNSFYKYFKLRSEYFVGTSLPHHSIITEMKLFSEKFFYGKEGFYITEKSILKLGYALKEVR